MNLGFRAVRIFDYVIGYLGLSTMILGGLETRGTLHDADEMAVWLLAGVLVPLLLGVIAAVVDTRAGLFSYGTLIIAPFFVDIATLVRYQLPITWIRDNLGLFVGMNGAAIVASCAGAWVTRRLTRTPATA